MKRSIGLVLMVIFLLMCGAGCGSAVALLPPTPENPTTLQVTRQESRSQDPAALRSWTITDVGAVQQLWASMQSLPEHPSSQLDITSGTRAVPYYSYHLEFFAGTRSLQQDELETYCQPMTANPSCTILTGADGSRRDPTTAFNSLLAGLLRLSPQEV
jgi:uncharacterized protein YceK